MKFMEGWHGFSYGVRDRFILKAVETRGFNYLIHKTSRSNSMKRGCEIIKFPKEIEREKKRYYFNELYPRVEVV